MVKRMKKAGVLALALGSLALGGAVFAQAQGGSQPNAQSSPANGESTAGPDTDTIQAGDQSGPDSGSPADAADQTGNGQQQGADAADQNGSQEQGGGSPEASNSESGSQSDGPGGHADSPGAVDHQFQGQE